jgi:phage shock protein PspC (stress-responsive transcriptional regulator)
MMDKTIKINIAGTLFQIDEEAFTILRDYLKAINTRFKNAQGGHETIEDIESRIAEIFQSQNGLAGSVSKENVETMISIIGKPEDFDQNEIVAEQPVHSSQKKRMYRNPDDTIISGVCGGIGAYLNTDPVIFRILFVLFTVFGGLGFIVYIALWIALPPANSDAQKRELFGNNYNSTSSQSRQSDGTYNTSRVGNAITEIFGAIGRVLYIILRIFLIIIGISLVITGFLFILSFFMIFVFKFPGAITSEGMNMNLTYFPDFLNFVVNPSLTPWILGLTLIAFILPMLALIYWGVKMIFWFKANDGIFSLAGLVLWVLALAALSIIIFNDGISFAQTGKSTYKNVLPSKPDTLFVITDHKVADLKFDKELTFPDEEYSIFMNEEKKELYIHPLLRVYQSDDDITSVEIKKRSAGRTRIDAMNRTEGLLYNYSIKGDTLLIDEYFTIPSGRKWSADNVGVNIYIPNGTILKFDNASGSLFHPHNNFVDDDSFDSEDWNHFNRTWTMTDDGLKIASKYSDKQK